MMVLLLWQLCCYGINDNRVVTTATTSILIVVNKLYGAFRGFHVCCCGLFDNLCSKGAEATPPQNFTTPGRVYLAVSTSSDLQRF